MNKNLNRRRFFYLNKRLFSYSVIIFLIFILFITFYTKKNFFLKITYEALIVFSEKFNYQYSNSEVLGLSKVDYAFIENKLQKYKGESIFLLPMKKISNEIKENNWIKNIKLTTNYKNTLYIELQEYKPIGLYNFNNKLFFFADNGKIIDEFYANDKFNEKLVIFIGPSSNLEANKIINILNSLNFLEKFKIKKIEYIKKRRWDIYLKNELKLMLSENSPKTSIQNFIKFKNNLSEVDINNIKALDLRDNSKIVIVYKS